MKRAIIGIINGVDCQVKLDETKTIRALAKRVCTATNNTGRPFADWEVFTDAGVRLEKAAKISSLKDGQRVFFNLRVGIGGGRCRMLTKIRMTKAEFDALPSRSSIKCCLRGSHKVSWFRATIVDDPFSGLTFIRDEIEIIEEVPDAGKTE